MKYINIVVIDGKEVDISTLDKEKREEKLRQLKEKIRERWENVKRVWRWVFPDYHYMASIYLTLEKLPVLLPVFWVIRGVRLLGRAIRK